MLQSWCKDSVVPAELPTRSWGGWQHFTTRTHWKMSSQTFCVTQIPTLVTWSIFSAFPSYAKVPPLQGLPGFEGTGRAHVHRLSSSSSELLTPQLQRRFKSGSNFRWHSFIKGWWCKFLLCVTILSVQIICMVCSTLSNLQLPTEENLLCVGTPEEAWCWPSHVFPLEYWWHCSHLGDLRG